MSDRPKVTNDAIVRYDDAVRWVKELLPQRPDLLESNLVQVEPVVAGIAASLADRFYIVLVNNGISEMRAAELSRHVARCGLICAEITRRGYQQFIQNTDNNEEGAP
jgi:hypothetical protein